MSEKRNRPTAGGKERRGGRAAGKASPPEGPPRRRKSDEEAARKPAGIGAYVTGLLMKGKSTDEVLKLVERQFPGAATSRASVSWYRSKLAKEGKHS
jgi:hypothetical protein